MMHLPTAIERHMAETGQDRGTARRSLASRRLAQELTQRQARKYVPFTERIGA